MKLLRKAVAADRVGYHPEYLMRLSRAGKFPKPVITGGRTVNFVENEVDAWIEAHIADRDSGVVLPRPSGLRNRVAKKDSNALAGATA